MKLVNVDFSELTDIKKLLSRIQEKFDSLEEENRSLRNRISMRNNAKKV